MGLKSKTAIAADFRATAEQERSTAIGLEASGRQDEADIHHGAARHFEAKASLTTAHVSPSRIVLGEAVDGDNPVIAWRPKNTLRKPEQVALDASAERKALLLGPNLDVCALALDAADSIDATNSLEKMLAHQLALAHRLAFDFANKGTGHKDPAIAIKWLNLSARMMDTFQGGLLAIQKLRSGNTQTVQVQHVSITGGQTVLAGTLQTAGLGEKPGGLAKK